VQPGEVVCLLGRNGVGKTTTLRSIVGLTPARIGSIVFKGMDITRKPPHEISRMGVGFVAQGRRLFQELTVRENLEVVNKRRIESEKDWTPDKIYELFPVLKGMDGRIAGSLSGGEQQMLAIGRTLMSNPELILLDEPSEGLAPLVVTALGDLVKRLASEGITILLAEQNLRLALGVSSRGYIMAKGVIRHEGDIEALKNDEEVKKRYLAV
jgi:branched-chain amino acid transport system ATP-binding protein